MKLYARREGGINEKRHALFLAMREDVERLPDIDPAESVTCHMVAHALAERHGVTAVTGRFGRNDHSWVDLGAGIVADMYPIACGVPFVVDTNGMLNPWSTFYDSTPRQPPADTRTGVDMILEYLAGRT